MSRPGIGIVHQVNLEFLATVVEDRADATEKYGDEWIKCMQAQELAFAADQNAALMSVARGEFAIGASLTPNSDPLR